MAYKKKGYRKKKYLRSGKRKRKVSRGKRRATHFGRNKLQFPNEIVVKLRFKNFSEYDDFAVKNNLIGVYKTLNSLEDNNDSWIVGSTVDCPTEFDKTNLRRYLNRYKEYKVQGIKVDRKMAYKTLQAINPEWVVSSMSISPEMAGSITVPTVGLATINQMNSDRNDPRWQYKFGHPVKNGFVIENSPKMMKGIGPTAFRHKFYLNFNTAIEEYTMKDRGWGTITHTPAPASVGTAVAPVAADRVKGEHNFDTRAGTSALNQVALTIWDDVTYYVRFRHTVDV